MIRFPAAVVGFALLAACDRGGDLGDLQIIPEALGPQHDTAAAIEGPRPEFAEVPAVPEANLRPAAVDFESHYRAPQFRTALSRGAAEGPNFAGHYTVVTWGCGTLCEEFMIVDARSGEVFDGRMTAVGVEHRLDSRLLLVNPPAAAAAAGCTLPACAPQYLVWTGERLEALVRDEDREAIRRAAAD
jgi:hypothetical protein